MGKNNQQRRAAKRRTRAANLAAARKTNAGDTSPCPSEPAPAAYEAPVDHEELIVRLIASGSALAFGSDANEAALDQVVQSLIVLQSAEQPLLPSRLVTNSLLQLVGMIWENGWQPLDLVHIVRRHQGAKGAALVTAVISEQAIRERAFERGPADWVAQLESLGAAPNGSRTRATDREWLVAGWQFAQGVPMWDGWRDALRLMGQIQLLHRLTPLGPPPSAWDRVGTAGRSAGPRPAPDPARKHADVAGHDPRMLSKIRALLSKAEASTFTEEADAFTSKAQDLMTRYAIDEALLEDSEGHGDVLTRRIHIDNPYAQAKVQLLSTVGGINRVRVIWDDHHGMATAVGMAIDLELVEMLFTSLLVQATRALTEAGNSRSTEGYQSGRLNRSPSFRRAFLLAYANRIGERLETADTAASTEATSSHGTELVPVLARRAKAVDTTFDRLFPETRQMRAKQVDARGWHAGRAAADKAVFASGQVESG